MLCYDIIDVSEGIDVNKNLNLLQNADLTEKSGTI